MIEHAKWIWANCEEEVNQYADFIKEFQIDRVDENASLEICSDREYAVWINGRFVSCGQYNDFPTKKVYDILAVGGFLKTGHNRICVTAQYHGEPTLQYAKSVRGVRFALRNHEQMIISDSGVLSAKSKTFKNGEIHKTTWQIGYGFEYDARKDDGWLDPTKKIGDRFAPSDEIQFETSFSPRPIRKLEITESIPSKIITQGYFIRKESDEIAAEAMQTDFLSNRGFYTLFEGSYALPGTAELKQSSEDGIYVIIDLGQEESGYLSFDLDINENARIDAGYGEHLEDMRVRTSTDGKFFANTYYCKEGRQSFTYYFRRMAGRYVELHISNVTKLKIYYVGMTRTLYPLENISIFKSGDSLHNMIYDVSVHTLRQCMHEHYEDCPWREQALYASDSRNQMLAGYYAFGEFTFPKESLKLLAEAFEEDGIQRLCAPTDIRHHKIPSFTMIWFLAVYEYMEYSGDVSLGIELWNKIRWAMDIYTRDMEDGLVQCPVGENIWNFYEWSAGCGGMEFGESYDAYRNSKHFFDGLHQIFTYLAVQNAVKIGKLCGKTEFVRSYETILETMKCAINRIFWNEEKGLYCSYVIEEEQHHYCELMQALAIVTGVAGEKTEKLCEALCYNKELVPITLSYAVYRYEALMGQNGKYDEFVFAEVARRWGRILRTGATTFWEIEDGVDITGIWPDASLCHGWSAIPIYLYFKFGLGVGPEHISGKTVYNGASKLTALGNCSGTITAKQEIVIP